MEDLALKNIASGSARRTIILALIFLVTVFATNGWSQTPLPAPGGSAGTPATKIEKESLGRDTPQGMVAGLINALGAGDYERAASFFAVPSVPAASGRYNLTGTELAREFKLVLDRDGNVITPAELSHEPGGKLNYGLPQDNNLFTDAGFTVKFATTPEKRAILKSLPPDKLVKRTKGGKTYYVYADPIRCNCAYVGTPEAYKAYQNWSNPGDSNVDNQSPSLMEVIDADNGTPDVPGYMVPTDSILDSDF